MFISNGQESTAKGPIYGEVDKHMNMLACVSPIGCHLHARPS